jgi:hypothetical protein
LNSESAPNFATIIPYSRSILIGGVALGGFSTILGYLFVLKNIYGIETKTGPTTEFFHG